MIFDVSHLGAAGVAHVLELATRPLLATHSSARALHDHHRNLTDDQLRGVAATGGVVCVNFFPGFLAEAEEDRTLEKLVDHIDLVASVAGIDHVGIGPDFLREVLLDVTPPCAEDLDLDDIDPLVTLPGLDGPAGLPLVTAGLVRRGHTETGIGKILGGNVHRLFRRGTGARPMTSATGTIPAAGRPAAADPAPVTGAEFEGNVKLGSMLADLEELVLCE
ncbi:dipeptidase [Streptomyces sp. E-08]|uniref:dipeptidase n=1 Tax=Streptomyces sp. E-08 TaxID=3404047 RepID=UPI003CEFF8AE